MSGSQDGNQASKPDSSSDPSNPTPVPPLMNPRFRHVSRSAAKRESVQLLGSIKDLQLHFSRSASIEHKPGSGAGIKGLNAVGEEGDENQPPPHGFSRLGSSMVAGPSRERKPWKEVNLTRIDPNVARAEARAILVEIKDLWQTNPSHVAASPSYSPDSPHTHRSRQSEHLPAPLGDSRQVLTKTAQSVRRLRELSLAVSTPPTRRVSSSTLTLPRQAKGRTSISTPSRPSTLPRAVSGGALPERKSALGVVQEPKQDNLAELRRAALEVLAALRGLEERLSITAGSENTPSGGSTFRDVKPQDSLDVPTGTMVSRPGSSLSAGITSEPESFNEEDEEEYNLNILAADGDLLKHLETWEERIISEGREYRQLQGSEGMRERGAVLRWVKVVEGVFLGVDQEGSPPDKGKWLEDTWTDNHIARIHDFLMSHLPLDLQLYLPNPADSSIRMLLLNRLSDGFILTTVLNSCVDLSSKTWGSVPLEMIHNTLSPGDASGISGSNTPEGAVDERISEGWTFRRTENLIAWAASIRHRYNIPVDLPLTKTSSAFLNPPHDSVRKSGTKDGRPIILPLPPGPAQVAATWKKEREQADVVIFDPVKVARREEGWDGMLEDLVWRWLQAVIDEAKEVTQAPYET